MNTKPFDIDLASAGLPVCTRDRRPVRILCFDMKDGFTDDNILALVSETDGSESAYCYGPDGRFADGDQPVDLMMATQRHTGYINIVRNRLLSDSVYEADRMVYESEEEARAIRHNTGFDVATVKVEWED